MPDEGDGRAPCAECGGTGWVRSADDPTRVTRCRCRRARAAARLLHASAVPPRYQHCTLDGFNTAAPDPASRAQLLRAVALCRRYIDEFLTTEGELRFRDTGLLFTGPPGAGKTHLAVATLRELIATYRVRGRFVDVTSLSQDLQTAIGADAPRSRAELLEPLEAVEVLVVDELGAQTLRPWAADVLYDLINRRYARRLPTLFTTNYALDDPAARPVSLDRGPDAPGGGVLSRRIPGMLVSRLWEMAQVVCLDAVKDYRMEVRAHQHRA